MIGNDDLRASAKLREAFLGDLGGFDFDIDGVSSVSHGQVEDGKLLLDAAVKAAVVLVAAAGGQQDAIGKSAPGTPGMAAAPLAGLIQKIQTEFQERFTRRGFAPCVVQESWNVWQAQRDTNSREQLGLRHW